MASRRKAAADSMADLIPVADVLRSTMGDYT